MQILNWFYVKYARQDQVHTQRETEGECVNELSPQLYMFCLLMKTNQFRFAENTLRKASNIFQLGVSKL